MKYFFAILILLSTITAQAQTPPKDKHAPVEEMAKDTAIISFQKKLKLLTGAIKEKQTNFAAVKKLFADNKEKMQALTKKYNTIDGEYQSNPSSARKKINPLRRLIPIDLSKVVYKAPYTGRDVISGLNYVRNYTTVKFTETEGKVSFVFLDNGLYADENVNPLREIGYKQAFYEKKIRIPGNPLYVAARVEIEYTWLYTGWDTYLASFQPMLGVFISNNFRSPGFDSLDQFMYEPRWKQVDLADTRFQNREPGSVKEFMFARDTSFRVEGYVTPGTEITIKAGFGMASGNSIGWYGSYHYGEFRLKRIIVTFLKAD